MFLKVMFLKRLWIALIPLFYGDNYNDVKPVK